MTRDTALGARPRLLAAAACGLVGVGVALAVLTTSGESHAGFHDETTAVVQVTGAFGLGVSGTAPDGGATGVQPGDPDPVAVGTTGGAVLSTHTPVEWRATVHATAAAGTATLTLFDPEDEPFVIGGTTYPDLFSTLRFTVLDVTDPDAPVTLAEDAPATEVNAAGLTLAVPAGGSRTVAVRALVAEGTWRMYDGRDTSMGLRFTGENS